MAGLFQELVEGAMDDEDNLNVVYRRVMAQAVKARQPASMQTNESLVNNWKNYLRT
jgi:predicted neutral ceramidase superfamily lipid hydrolase